MRHTVGLIAALTLGIPLTIAIIVIGWQMVKSDPRSFVVVGSVLVLAIALVEVAKWGLA